MSSDTQAAQAAPVQKGSQGTAHAPQAGSQVPQAGSQAAPEQWKIFRTKNVDRLKKKNYKLDLKTTDVSKTGLTGVSFVESIKKLLGELNSTYISDNNGKITFTSNNITCNDVVVFNENFNNNDIWSDALKKYYAYYYVQLLTQLITDCVLDKNIDVDSTVKNFNEHVNALLDIKSTDPPKMLTTDFVNSKVNSRLENMKGLTVIVEPTTAVQAEEDVTNIDVAYENIVIGGTLIKHLYDANKNSTANAPAGSNEASAGTPRKNANARSQGASTPTTNTTPGAAQGTQGTQGAAQGTQGTQGAAAAPAAQAGPAGPAGPNVEKRGSTQAGPAANPTGAANRVGVSGNATGPAQGPAQPIAAATTNGTGNGTASGTGVTQAAPQQNKTSK
jgi:hypothetical protein